MEQPNNFTGWIIARAADCSYIGRPSQDAVLSWQDCGRAMKLEPAFELTSTVLPAPEPTQGGGIRIHNMRAVEVASVLAMAHEVAVMVRPTTVIRLADMHADDREAYERMIRGAYQRLEQIQRDRSPIAVPKIQLPKGSLS